MLSPHIMPLAPKLHVPRFGAWLGESVWAGDSYREIANRLRPHVEGVKLKLDHGNVVQWEKGRVPSWPILLAISAAYRVPIADILTKLLESLADDSRLPLSGNRQDTSARGISLATTKDYKGRSSLSLGGVSHVPSARVVAQRLRSYQLLARRIAKLATALDIALAAADHKGAAAHEARSTPRARRGRTA